MNNFFVHKLCEKIYVYNFFASKFLECKFIYINFDRALRILCMELLAEEYVQNCGGRFEKLERKIMHVGYFTSRKGKYGVVGNRLLELIPTSAH